MLAAEAGWLPADKSCALLSISRRELYRRAKPGDAQFIISKRERGRRLFAVASFPFDAQKRYRETAEIPASPPSPVHPANAIAKPDQQELFTRDEIGQAIETLRTELSGDDVRFKVVVQRWKVIEPLSNHGCKSIGYATSRAYVEEIARTIPPHGVHKNTIWRWVADFRRAQKIGGRVAGLKALATSKPGPPPGTGSVLTPDMKNFIMFRWMGLSGTRLTRSQMPQAVHDYIARKQIALGPLYAYSAPKQPLKYAIIRFINRELTGDLNPRRGGPEAIKTAAGHIIRHYDDELAGDCWCMDEHELNGGFFNAEKMRQLVGYGKGNPLAHILSIVDERTTYILDGMVTWKISLEDGTLILAERLLRKYWLPLRFNSDRAGRFRQLVRGHMVVGSGGDLVQRLSGPFGELGVQPRGSEEKNPRANRIERIHLEYARRATKFGVSYKPPLKKHEPRQIDEQVKLHLKNPTGGHLISIQQAEQMIAQWIEEINNAPTEAKGCKGLTRREAFEYFRPSAEEILKRTPSPALVDLAFAERLERTVQPGGMLKLADGRWYSSLELAGKAGEKVRIIRYRRDPSQIIVLLGDQEDAVIADYREPVGTQESAKLAREIERLKHARKVLAGEQTPREMPEDPEEVASLPSMSSSEWMMSHRPALSDQAREAFPDLDSSADSNLAQTIIPREFFREDEQ